VTSVPVVPVVAPVLCPDELTGTVPVVPVVAPVLWPVE